MDPLGTQVGVDNDDTQSDRKNFTEAEDLLLCSAWSNTTNDDVAGIDQSGDHYWVKAHMYWMQHKKEQFPKRNPNTLMQRFSKIKTAVNKFCGFLAQVEDLSGYNEDDKIAQAKKMYVEFVMMANTKKKTPSKKAAKFAFEHCWKALKNDQKWLELSASKKPARAETSSNPGRINVDSEDTSSTPRSVERPVGRKLAKEGRTKRKGKFIYDSSSIMEKMDQTIALNEKLHNDEVAMYKENDKKMDEFLGLEKENLDLKKAKFGMEKQMFNMDMALKEAEIMKIDISSLNDPDQIEFFQAQKKIIKARYQAEQ